MGEKTMVVSITCNKKRDTMIKVCEVFESLNLKVLTANITNVSGSLLHTLFIEVALSLSLSLSLSGVPSVVLCESNMLTWTRSYVYTWTVRISNNSDKTSKNTERMLVLTFQILNAFMYMFMRELLMGTVEPKPCEAPRLLWPFTWMQPSIL